MFSQQQLKDRGWSLGLIRSLLGEPDEFAPNPVFRSKAQVKLWKEERVEKAEKHPKFIAHQHRRKNYSLAAKSVAANKRDVLLTNIGDVDIQVEKTSVEQVIQDGVKAWEELGEERGDYLRIGTDADEATKSRWAVNYIRRNLVVVRNLPTTEPRHPGINEARAMLEHKIYSSIAESYPELKNAALRQATRLWGLPSISQSAKIVSLTSSYVIVPSGQESEGILVHSASAIWFEIIELLASDWEQAYRIPSEKWEEIVAGAFHREGYDEVILTPRSADHGRDIIATRHGIGSVRVLGSVKANGPHRLVDYNDIRALMGVVAADHAASKGIITTTSDFPPRVENDPFIKPLLPTRLELINGEKLQSWLSTLALRSIGDL